MKNILIIEDDQDIIGLLSFALESNDYNVIEAHDGQEGFEKYSNNQIDLIITDAMMPNIDGYQFVKLVRIADKTTPIIMLTALKAAENELEGFDVGVNDYVSKPFSIDVLLKRIENQLYPINSEEEPITEIIDRNIRIDLEGYRVYVDKVEISLTRKEFSLLVELIQNSGKVLSRKELIDHIWGENYFGDARNIDTHIKNIRRKINNDNIRTVKGIGYMYEKAQ
ncbi:response regulator transcription factor [Mollicutes bacterium LVI A0078]|nr:response regulator transcription factor [Mollicutes bacterium LVI A0075]WOO91245.1 response regulator transcription factor [Mollicutes bacterium LVI A0078]